MNVKKILSAFLLSLLTGSFAFPAQQTLTNSAGMLTKANQNFDELYAPIARTANEIAAGITPTAIGYREGDLRRYGVSCLAASEGQSPTTLTAANTNATANTAILVQVGAAGWVSPITFRWPAGRCGINDTVTFSNINISHNFESRSTIDYWGTADRVAVVQGNASTSQGTKEVFGGNGISIVNHTTNPYTNESFIGLQILGTMQNSKNVIRVINGFTIGMQLRPSTNGIAYNVFDLYQIIDNKYGIDIHSFTNGTTEFVNENLFNGGSFRTSGMADTIDAYGVRFAAETGAYRGHNRNVFMKPSFEMQTAAGATYRSAVLYENAGGRNEILQARMETGRTAIVKINSPTFQVAGNVFECAILGGTFTNYQESVAAGLAFNNSFVDLTYMRPHQQPQWHSGDLVKKAWPSTSTQISIKGLVWGIQTNATLAYTQSGRVAKDYIIVADSARGFGVQIDTTYYKNFLIRKDVRAGFGGRVTFVAFDSTGTILTDASGAHPYVVSNTPLTAASGATTWGGQKYATASDGVGPLNVTVGPDVATLRMFFTAGTVALHMRSFSIYAFANEQNPRPLRVFTGLAQNEDMFYSTGVPGANLGGGLVPRGQLVMNAAAANGQPSGWVATAEGWLAKAWVLSTAYVIGELSTNDTGKTYEQMATSCTSASSGGPTGTGSAITDNTCSWNYIGTQATIAPLNQPQTVRVSTGSVSAASTALVTCTWPTAFSDTNYTAQASVVDSTTSSLSLSVVHLESVAAGSMTVRVINNAAGSLTGTVHCNGIHD